MSLLAAAPAPAARPAETSATFAQPSFFARLLAAHRIALSAEAGEPLPVEELRVLGLEDVVRR